MTLMDILKASFDDFLQKTFAITPEQIKRFDFELNSDDSKKEFGDINSNAAMIIAKQLKRNPKELAESIKTGFTHEYIKKIECAGPGFLNLFFTDKAFIELTKELVTFKEDFFKLNPKNKADKNYSLEFVSANPTGPLHFGHGRGGIIGDVLANILNFLGYKVSKEFYINDAGNQIAKLGLSLKVRCLQLSGINAELPQDGYQGEYMIDLAKKCLGVDDPSTRSGCGINKNDIQSKDDSFFENYAKENLLEIVKKTLIDYGITYDVWFSEKSLHDNNKVEEAIKKLTESGYTYEKDDALWFKSTEFGDDKDRVLKKGTGEYTYVASDIAYMLDKIERGYNHLIMILGQDHHSYVTRLHGIQKALKLEEYPLDIILYQLVKMKESDQILRMSKRAGIMVTLQDIIDTVGKDVARFFYLNRKADAQLEFDIDLALKKTEENPVYYIQYAYVRTKGILEKAEIDKNLTDININDSLHIGPEEAGLLKKIVSMKMLLESVSINYQTHLLAYYLVELATIFHRYYSHHRIIEPSNIQKSRARLLMMIILRDTFGTGLKLLGISRPEKM